MSELSAFIFALLQLVLWTVIILLCFSSLMNYLFPKTKWHKKILPKVMRFIFIEPFKNLYRAGKWLIVRIFTTRPDYRLQQIYLENYPVAPLAFYEAVEIVIAQRQIIGVEISRISRREWHLLSARRIYLLIRFRKAVCFIGAMPVGTSFLVSWRYTAMPSRLFLILFQIPVVGVIAEKLLAPPTFYRTDIYYAFEQIVRSSLLETTNLLANQGIRPLAENEQRPLLREFYE
ncbi:MAG: hypothetical protein ACR2MG_10845 [Pyrinomonadaceae bacterium]